MAVAMIYPEAEAGGRGKKSEVKKSEIISGFSERLVQQSRTVLAFAPDLAPNVLAGTVPLDAAYIASRDA